MQNNSSCTRCFSLYESSTLRIVLSGPEISATGHKTNFVNV